MTKPIAAKRPGNAFTQEIADAICLRLMEGESLRHICLDEAMPAKSTVFKWLLDIEGFDKQYTLALEIKASGWFDEIIEISDKPLVGEKTVKDLVKGTEKTTYGDNVERSKLMADNRKWVLSRMFPKKYGEFLRQELTAADGAPLAAVINLSTSKPAAGGAAPPK